MQTTHEVQLLVSALSSDFVLIQFVVSDCYLSIVAFHELEIAYTCLF